MRPVVVALLLLLCTICLAQDNLPAEKVPAPPASAAAPTPTNSYQDRATEVITTQRGPVAAEIFRAERLRRCTIGGLLLGFGILVVIIGAITASSSSDAGWFCALMIGAGVALAVIGICYLAGSNREAMLYVVGSDPAFWPR